MMTKYVLAAHSGVADIYGLLGRDTTRDNLKLYYC